MVPTNSANTNSANAQGLSLLNFNLFHGIFSSAQWPSSHLISVHKRPTRQLAQYQFQYRNLRYY